MPYPIPAMFLRTERLLFRPFAAGDLEPLFRIVADPEVVRYTDDGGPLDWATTRLWIERSRENVARHGYGTGAVIELATGRLIGWAGFARPEGAPEEMIYGFERPAWGRGYGSEIATALVPFAFEDLGLSSLRATVHPDNAASRHILRKLGFAEVTVTPEVVELILRKAPTAA